jgi:hypothetical protein
MKKAVYGLFGACGVLAALLIYEVAAPLPALEIPAAQARPRTRTASAVAAVVVPPPGAFAEIDARPPFNSTRKGIAATVGGDASSAPPDVVLVGIIASGGDQLALVKTPSSPLATAFRTGATISGWQVTEIHPDRIVLSSGPARSEIRLEANRAPPPKPTAPVNSQ